MTARDAEFQVWLDDLVTVFVTGHGYDKDVAYQRVEGSRAEWRDYFDDGYTPRMAAIQNEF